MDIIGLCNVRKKQGVAINEICVETAATRTTYVRTKEDDEHFRMETEAYYTITYIVNLLAASFGIEERELLRAGIQNREEFKSALTKNISTGGDILLREVDLLECNLDILFRCLYVEKENSINETMIAASLKQIQEYIYEITKLRIAFDTREINREYAESLAYDYRKIEKIILKSIVSYEVLKYIDKKTKGKLEGGILKEELELIKQISDIITVAEKKNKLTDEHEWQEAVKAAKVGEYIDMFGTEEEKSLKNRLPLVENYPKTNHEFDHVVQWDNESVIRIMKQLWIEKEVVDVRKEIIFETIGGFFSRFRNRKLKKLNSPSENGEDAFVEPKSDFDERYRVNPEELKPLKPFSKPETIEKENGKE